MVEVLLIPNTHFVSDVITHKAILKLIRKSTLMPMMNHFLSFVVDRDWALDHQLKLQIHYEARENHYDEEDMFSVSIQLEP